MLHQRLLAHSERPGQGKAEGKPGSTKGKKKDAKWYAMYTKLKAYKERFGDCIVPRGSAENAQLASWVAEQR
jgi:hypothetical protein